MANDQESDRERALDLAGSQIEKQFGKDFLTEAEMRRFLDAARHGRHGVRDYLMMPLTYRHGLRVSELVDLRLKDLGLDTGRLYVCREKGSLSTHQPIEGDEVRALRLWLREREQRREARSSYLALRDLRNRGLQAPVIMVVGLSVRNWSPSRAATSRWLRSLSRMGVRCRSGDPIDAASGASENMIGTSDSGFRTQHLAEQF